MHYLYTDGGARGNPGPAAGGYLIYDEDQLLTSQGNYLGIATNNKAEYSALIAGLQAAIKLDIKELTCKLDSELVVKQVRGEYKVKHPDMKPLHDEVQKLVAKFSSIEFRHVPRAENSDADAIVNQTLDAHIGS